MGCTEGQKPTAHCRPSYWLALAVIGAPAEAQRSGFGGERRPSGGNELSGLPGSERSVAWADDAAPRAARIAVTPQALRAAALYRVRPPGRHRCHAPEIPRRSPRVCVGLGELVRLPGPLSLPCSVGRGLAPAACPPGISWGTPQYYLTIPHLSEVYFFDRPIENPKFFHHRPHRPRKVAPPPGLLPLRGPPI